MFGGLVAAPMIDGRPLVRSLAQTWPLRGADLWHLSAAKAMQADVPELQFVTFDARLSAAAHGEGLR